MSNRKSIDIKGFQHTSPIPNATRIGNMLMSGVIGGRDPGKSSMPADLDGQIANMFAHVREIMETAGGSMDDIIKITFWLRDPSKREHLDGPWAQAFPDPAARPSRHTHPMPGSGDALVQCDVTAVFS